MEEPQRSLLPNGDISESRGKYTWPNGSSYEGEWFQGKKNGKGKMCWASGASYEGDFVAGHMHGIGTYVGRDGSLYIGDWQFHKKHGFGEQRYANGDIYKGIWKSGSREGDGEVSASVGTETDGEKPLLSPKQAAPEKKKRGRKPKVQAPKLPPPISKDEEDVCFVCFDGGELILCDKRACPKAYHVECTGRDSEYFSKKGAWFCGWHYCAHCGRSASAHCYTCPNSYCNNCIREADFLSIRKARGLCDVCFPIAYMLEYHENLNPDEELVDFDDEETYEYFFKDYWEDIRKKLDISWEEINKAQKAKEDGTQLMESGVVVHETEGHYGSDAELEDGIVTRRRQLKRKRRVTRSSVVENDSDSEYEPEEEDGGKGKRKSSRVRDPDLWASKELLEFLQCFNVDPKKGLSRITVNKLLWSYVDSNKLQNSRKRGQIVCDERLQKLFGMKAVGRFEMMKLLSSHFQPKKGGGASKAVRSVEADALEHDYNEEKWVKGPSERQRGRPRKKADDNKYVKPHSSEYAAINVSNIDMIYLKRALLEELLADPQSFNKVVGAFVRIRVPGVGTKIDACYRLVPVVGVKMLPGIEKLENGSADVVLEILNLQKREEVTVDLVSNQDFTEEECQRLRQSVKFGFLKAMTVGELEEKATALHEVKVKDWLEAELLRLSHLRDRASEKGRKRELRECVEKIQLLSSLEEREKRLSAAIQIVADPHMDPDYESEEEMHVPGKAMEPPDSWDKWQGGRSQGDSSSNHGHAERSHSSNWWDSYAASYGSKEALSSASHQQVFSDRNPHSFPSEKRSGGGGKFSDEGLCQDSGTMELKPSWGYPRREAQSDHNSFGSAPPASSGAALKDLNDVGGQFVQEVAFDEREKIWHYRDPTGKVQGPFSMEQLRKWEKTKLFPNDLRIWKNTQKPDDGGGCSVLLRDVLFGNNVPPPMPAPVPVPGYPRALVPPPPPPPPPLNPGRAPARGGLEHDEYPNSKNNGGGAYNHPPPSYSVSIARGNGNALADGWNPPVKMTESSLEGLKPLPVEGGSSWGAGGGRAAWPAARNAKVAADDGWAPPPPKPRGGLGPPSGPENAHGASYFREGPSAPRGAGGGRNMFAPSKPRDDSWSQPEDVSWVPAKAGSDACWGPPNTNLEVGWGPPKASSDAGRGPPNLGLDAGWGPPKASLDAGRGPPNTSLDIGWGLPKTSSEAGWGPPKASMDAGRGPPNTNLDIGWGPPKASAKASSDAGWGPPNTSSDAGRGPPNTSSDASWGPPSTSLDIGRGPPNASSDVVKGPPVARYEVHANIASSDVGRAPPRLEAGWGPPASSDGGWGPPDTSSDGGWSSHVEADSASASWGSFREQKPIGRDRVGLPSGGSGRGREPPPRNNWGGRDPNYKYPDQNQNRSTKPGFVVDSWPTRKMDVPCKFFHRGMCKKGPDCEFRHA